MKISLTKNTPDAWAKLREKRDELLRITDSYVLPDRGTAQQREEVAMYRAALRDLTKTAKSPAYAVFPAAPSFVKELQQ